MSSKKKYDRIELWHLSDQFKKWIFHRGCIDLRYDIAFTTGTISLPVDIQ